MSRVNMRSSRVSTLACLHSVGMQSVEAKGSGVCPRFGHKDWDSRICCRFVRGRIN